MPRKSVSKEIHSLREILGSPAIPALVRSLPPRELARLCARIGIGDATEIMALTPAVQLVRALEASVWKTPRPGVAEVFDAHELVEWFWAWLEIGETFTAERLAAVPDETLMLYLSQVTRVTTSAMWGFERSTEIEDLDRIYAPSHDDTVFGPYVVSARHDEDREILRGALEAMWLDAPQRLLQLFSMLSGDESMLAPQSNRESANDDLILARERSHERQGYVTANGAGAFLSVAQFPVEHLATLCEYDLETKRHLAILQDALVTAAHAGSQLSTQAGDEPCEDPATCTTDTAHLAALQTALEDAGLLEPPVERLLLAYEGASNRLPIVRLLQALAEQNMDQFHARGRELAYLASVLVAGIAVDSKTLSPADARSAALATCNLGLETLQSLDEKVQIDREPGLVRLFLVGFHVVGSLPGKVANSFAKNLTILKKNGTEPLHEWLVEQAEISVAELFEALDRRDFEAAREAAIALGFVFDPHACRAVTPLFDELPRLSRANGGEPVWIDSMAAMASLTKLVCGISAKPRTRSRN